MQPRLDDANIEYSFLPQEAIAARILDTLKLAWLQTKYSQYWKMRNSVPASEVIETDRSYFLKIAELDGRMNMIQILLDDHKAALEELRIMQANPEATNSQTEAHVAQKAADLVHKRS